MTLPVLQWRESDVSAWLQHNNLGRYRQMFADKSIRGADLVQLDDQRLLDMGVAVSVSLFAKDFFKRKKKQNPF